MPSGVRIVGWYQNSVDLVFEAVVVGVAEDVDAAVVAGGEEAAVGCVEDVVDVGDFDGQLADGEAGDKRADERVIGGGQSAMSR